ncbi:hypothetical protein [Dokdonella sp.]|uniref:hypothetical protein n=1 Tax=Dokdonella sp. TaxID=2291710 RepID=UPI002F40B4DE
MTLYQGNVRKAGLALALSIGSAAAHAAPPVGNAAAYDLSVHINLVGITQLDVGAQTSSALVDVVASANDSETLPSFGITDPLALISLSTGVLSSETEYVGGPMSAIAARSTVANLDLGAGTAIVDVLGLGAGLVRSTSSMSGYCPDVAPIGPRSSLLGDFVFGTGFDFGNLNGGGGGGADGGGLGGLPPGGTDLVDPVVSLLGVPVPGLPLDPPPNTAVDLGQLGIVGATLILNEQSTSGDGVHSLSTASNAIHLTMNVASLVTADVVIAHSEAGLACP